MKKIWRYFLGLALFLPCMFCMVGCGAPQIIGFSVYIGGKPFSETNNTINVIYGDEIVFDSQIVVKKRLSNNTEQTISLGENGYALTSGISETPTVGVYNLTVSYGLFPDVDIKVDVHKRALAKPTLAMPTLEYSGESQTMQLDGFDPTYMEITADSDDLTQTALIGENGYIVRIQLKDSANCEWAGELPDGDTILQWYIVKKSGQISNVSDIGKIYDGMPVNEPDFDSIGDGEATIEYRQGDEPFDTIPPTDAGDYFVRISIPETEMFSAVSVERHFEISQADDEITSYPENIGKVYDGTPITAPTFNCLGDGTKTVKYRKAEGYSDLTTEEPKEPGDYVAELIVSGSTNHKGITKGLPFTIEKITLTLTASNTGDFAPKYFTKSYDGTYVLRAANAGRFSDLEEFTPFTFETNGLLFDIENDGIFEVVRGAHSVPQGAISDFLYLSDSDEDMIHSTGGVGTKFLRIGYRLDSLHFKLESDVVVLVYEASISKATIESKNITLTGRVAKGAPLSECLINTDGVVIEAKYALFYNDEPRLRDVFGTWEWLAEEQTVTESGEYTIIFTPTLDFNPVNINVFVTVCNSVPKPTVNESVYTDSALEVSLVGFDEELMELVNDEKQTNVGTYIIKVRLKDAENDTWEDGTVEDLELEWNIVIGVTLSGKDIVVIKNYDSSSVLPNADDIVFEDGNWLFSTNYSGDIADLGEFSIVETGFYTEENGDEPMSASGKGFFKLVLRLDGETYQLKNTTLWFEAEILAAPLLVDNEPTYYKATEGYDLSYAEIDASATTVIVQIYDTVSGEWTAEEVDGVWGWKESGIVSKQGYYTLMFTPESALFAPIELSVLVKIQRLEELFEFEFAMDGGWVLLSVSEDAEAEGHILVPGKWCGKEGCGAVYLEESLDGLFGDNEKIIRLTFGEGITELVANTVVNCVKLKEIILPDTLTKIMEGAISGCTSLTSLTIPSSVTYVDFNGFDAGLTIYIEGKASSEEFDEGSVVEVEGGPTIIYLGGSTDE